MGDVSFPLDTDFDLDTQRALCTAVAAHVENGGAVPAIEIEPSMDGHRDWAQVRRFYIDRRQREKKFVTERLHNYRDVVDDLVNGLRQISQRDQETETSVRKNLDTMETAVDAGGLPEIRAALNQTIKNIADTFARQKEQYEAQIHQMNERMSNLRQDLVAAREEMQRDTLTDAYNRGAFDTAIEQSLKMHFILNQPVTLVMIDLDKFKEINDTYGHAAGDEVLRCVSDSLARSFNRKSDLVARYGGDEFAVILSDTKAENSETLIERFLKFVNEIQVPDAGDDIVVSCSAGFTEICIEDSVESLIKRADTALYEAKAAGRNCLKFIAPPE